MNVIWVLKFNISIYLSGSFESYMSELVAMYFLWISVTNFEVIQWIMVVSYFCDSFVLPSIQSRIRSANLYLVSMILFESIILMSDLKQLCPIVLCLCYLDTHSLYFSNATLIISKGFTTFWLLLLLQLS